MENQVKMTFEEWLAKFENDINTELAENGSDREMDFDIEQELDKRYQNYLNTNIKHI